MLLLVLGAIADEEPLAGANGAGMFWFGIGHDGSHGSEVVLEGVGILLAPFLRDLLTHDLEAVKEALGIFGDRSQPGVQRGVPQSETMGAAEWSIYYAALATAIFTQHRTNN